MKTVLITGAAGGLGSAAAEMFIARGYTVVKADVAFESIEDERPGRQCIRLPLDVVSTASVEEAASALREMAISVDILINNAGVFDLCPLSEDDPEKALKVLQVNAMGAVRMIRAFLPDLIKNRGRVVQISSESVKFPGAFQPYQVSKIALEAYSRSVRQELGMKGVSLVIIRPGAIDTKLSRDLGNYQNPVPDSIFRDEFTRFVSMAGRFSGRYAPPERIARLVIKVSLMKRPRYLYRINNNPLLTMMSLLPPRWVDFWIRKTLGRPR